MCVISLLPQVLSDLNIGLAQLIYPEVYYHENVMRVLGVVAHNDGSLGFVYEYCGSVDLGQHFLNKYPEVKPLTTTTSSSSSSRRQLVLDTAYLRRQQGIIGEILQGAHGYRHLHEVHGVVQVDGKPANIMVSDKGCVKIIGPALPALVT
jgi:serine/threonine protein kinase